MPSFLPQSFMEPYLSLGFWRAEADEVQTLLLRGLGGDAGESQGTEEEQRGGKADTRAQH